jgi:C-terminal processing protease CtpA/Prc
LLVFAHEGCAIAVGKHLFAAVGGNFEITGGGLGIPNGGQLPNGWTYRFSISRTLSPAGENFENGVPPDIQVVLTKADRDRGVDTVIERAIQELK